jgi:hypothetical protein
MTTDGRTRQVSDSDGDYFKPILEVLKSSVLTLISAKVFATFERGVFGKPPVK